jgi:hypothetical protein
MTLFLNQSSRNATSFCAQCCKASIGCCTTSFQNADRSSVNLIFNNFRFFENDNGTSESNPWLDFNISNFTATLKREDLVDSNFKQNYPGQKNYYTFENNPTDLIDEGFQQPSLPGLPFVQYLITSRLITIPVSVSPKTATFDLPPDRVDKPSYYYPGPYYADMVFTCSGSRYYCQARLLRVLSPNDPPANNVAGLTPTIGMIVGFMSGYLNIFSCDPLFGYGTFESVIPIPRGFHFAQDLGISKFAYYTTSTDGYNLYAYTPFNYKMDWYITE